ncbi:unnamed protein product [Amoebophrya sp. A120]|nr:unnamed protein product [Amoebophrya sp. A120]|eukprot:GSA120T00001091001.1
MACLLSTAPPFRSRQCRLGVFLQVQRRTLSGASMLRQQAECSEWFLQLAKRFAPDLEFFTPPYGSGLPLLVRPRSNDLNAHSGVWIPMQLRSTRRTDCLMRGKVGTLCNVGNFGTPKYWQNKPMLLGCPGRKIVFVYDNIESKFFRVRLDSDACVDVATDSGQAELGRRLRKICEMRGPEALSLEDCILTGGRVPTKHANRYRLLAQAMQYPVFRELTFPPGCGTSDGSRYNCHLRGFGVHFRAGRSSPTKSGSRVGFCKYVDGAWSPLAATDGIEMFLWLLPGRRSPSQLQYIGLVPARVLLDRGLLSTATQAGGVHHYIRWKSDTELDFDGRYGSGLAQYFIRCDESPEVIAASAERILAEATLTSTVATIERQALAPVD